MPGQFLILLALVLVNGFFAMAELSVVAARRTRLKQLAEAGSGGARAALRLLADPTRFLSSVQVGITLISVLAGVYSGAKFAEPLAIWLVQTFPVDARQAEAGAFAGVVALVTYLSLIVGELVPKRWAMSHPEAIAAFVARPMEWIAKGSAPVVWVLQRSTDAVLRLTGLRARVGSPVTEEEVRTLIAEGAREGIFQHAEHRMIEGVLKLADRTVRSVMIPRGDIVWLDVEDSREAVRDVVQASGHSRYLVCRGEVDELVGVVHVRELMQWLRGTSDLAQYARAPLVVQETTTVLRLLELFRESGLHFATIVDEHGSVEGLVTPTDVLQAIAGELPDIGDSDVPEAVQRGPGSWLVDGRLPIDAVERLLGRDDMMSGDDYTTLAGFALAQLGHLPSTAETFAWKDLRFEIVDMDGRRIDKLLVERRPAAGGQDSFEPETQA